MRRSLRYVLFCAPFVVLAFLMVSFGQRHALSVPPSLPLDQSDILQLAAYLNEAGVQVRAQPIPNYGIHGDSAFLTLATREWRDLNNLSKDSRRIQEWRGIVYCERASPDTAASLAWQWGDRGLLVGPFVFYGDAELLARISAALNHPALVNEP